MNELMTAWYNLLTGHGYDVYKEDIPEEHDGHYILLRAEGGSSANNKRSFADEAVVIVDIVTLFKNNVDRSVVETIDGVVQGLIFPTVNSNGLTEPSGFRFLDVKREGFSYLNEDDNVNKYYRKVSRYTQRVLKTS